MLFYPRQSAGIGSAGNALRKAQQIFPGRTTWWKQQPARHRSWPRRPPAAPQHTTCRVIEIYFFCCVARFRPCCCSKNRSSSLPAPGSAADALSACCGTAVSDDIFQKRAFRSAGRCRHAHGGAVLRRQRRARAQRRAIGAQHGRLQSSFAVKQRAAAVQQQPLMRIGTCTASSKLAYMQEPGVIARENNDPAPVSLHQQASCARPIAASSPFTALYGAFGAKSARSQNQDRFLHPPLRDPIHHLLFLRETIVSTLDDATVQCVFGTT